MLSKSACLASSTTTTAAAYKTSRLFLARTTFPATKIQFNSTKSLFKSPPPPPPRLLSFNHQLATQFTTSSFNQFNKSPDKKPPPPTTTTTSSSPLISDDLKKILNAQVGNESSGDNGDKKKQQQQQQQQDDPDGDLISKEKAWKYTKYMYIAFAGWMGCFCVYLLHEWGKPRVDEASQITIRDEFTDLPFYLQYPKRAVQTAFAYYEAIKDPSTEKLLPEPIQLPYYQPPYTLVIELTGVLLHPEWTFSTGWRYKKRPGLDYFLSQVKYPLFELVFFTKEPYLTGTAITNSLDPPGENQITNLKLYRESTKFVNNTYVKDLSYMNRDLSKIIVIDCDEKAYQLQPRNALHRLKKWEGNDDDTDLVYLASFLKLIAQSGANDVREILDYYNEQIDPLEAFKINQVKLQENELKRQRELDELKQKQKKSIFSSFRR